MNRGLPVVLGSGLVFVLGLIGCSGSNSTPPPTGCTSTATIKCTQSGAIQGEAAAGLFAFRGIPYAAPPVGNLRWKAPQPPASWGNNLRYAVSFGNECPQFELGTRQYGGDEDCLTLNIFISQTQPMQPRPVMVFFHGGGNFAGNAHSSPTQLDVPPLANQGVIVVTAQYRLGYLGFLTTPQLAAEDSASAGAYGLLDMIAALKWVKQNIAAFGGDPTRVLLFGQSAGSFDIQMLLASPAAQGLFSAAGMISGAVPLASQTTWLLSGADAAATTGPFISAMGCGNAADILACLRGVPVATIVNYSGSIFLGPGFGTPFLPIDSFAYLQQNGSPVPLLVGSTSEEYTAVRDGSIGNIDASAYMAAVHQRFDPVGAGVADQVLSLYPAVSYDSPYWALVAVDSDYQITCETRGSALASVGANRKPVWRYIYTHRYENDINLNGLRACHTCDLYFLFGNFNPVGPIPNYQPTPAELTFSEDLMGYWTRFAATGDPNGGGAVAWPQYDANAEGMLQLDDAFVAINGFHVPQCSYLETLTQP